MNEKMTKAASLALCLLLPLALGLTLQEDDLVFDDVGEEVTVATTGSRHHVDEHRTESREQKNWRADDKRHQPERSWALPNAVVAVGHVYKQRIPKQAFTGNVDHFEARGGNGRSLPRWLHWDDAASTLLGVPSKKDVGNHRVSIKAFRRHGDPAKGSFAVQVIPEKQEEIKHKDGKTHCRDGEEQTLLSIILDAKFEDLSPLTKVEAIENLAGFLGLHSSGFSIHPQTAKDMSNPDTSVILTGPGNVRHRKEKHWTAIQWQVGCEGHLWKHQTDLVKQLREQAKDGTLAEVLQLPVLLWRVKSDSSSFLRNRREAGSGDYGTEDEYGGYDDYDDDYDEDAEEEGDDENEPITKPPIQSFIPDVSTSKLSEHHPHRHRHGEENIFDVEEEINAHNIVPVVDQNALESTANFPTESIPQTSTELPAINTTKQSTTMPFSTTSGTSHSNFTTSGFLSSHASTWTTSVPTTTQMHTLSTSASTAAFNASASTTPVETTTVTTTVTTPITTTVSTTSTTTAATTMYTQSSRIPTETSRSRNQPPQQHKKLQKIPVTAGKPFSYIIPADTFSDFEDGDTRKLSLNLYRDGAPLSADHWLQFNPHTQEIYGLPVREDVSMWNYNLVATDSEGHNASDGLFIYVQQHKLRRSVNHEFSLYLKIDKRGELRTDVDWELKVIRSLTELYGDNDAQHITVRTIDIEGDQAIFTWANDSVPRTNECPEEYIFRLLRVLVADKGEKPSPLLRKLLAPEIRVERVVLQGIGQCEDLIKPELPKINLPPLPRNQVDRINATVGQLLVFTVPEDTFFDKEDGSSRKMKMSLLTMDRMPIPEHEWLQFDSNNQEFYGVPMKKDIGRKEYQLVVTDSKGATATDGLVVVVQPAPAMQHTVEFSMTLDIPYNSFSQSAYQKRSFIEKLRDLYGDKDTNAISLSNITDGSTVVTWHNITLPTTYCAHEEVNRLRSVLVKSEEDRRSVTDEVAEFMGPNFPVTQITVIPMGICLGELTGIHSPDSHVPPVDDSTSVGTFHDDYLITFVLPAIIIAAMLILAGIIACVLYRRRRSGKMSVSEHDDERQSFRSKGIPVIFQDELDEKPDPGNKSPVILKEEKPPLPPPEYQKTEDGADVPMLPKENSEEPYQPPPPFATNRETNRQNRPKPTPTYRKPPPYVPP